jgi:hypothetical protein
MGAKTGVTRTLQTEIQLQQQPEVMETMGLSIMEAL